MADICFIQHNYNRTSSVVHVRNQVAVAVGWKLVEHSVMQLGACTADGMMGLLVSNRLECLGGFKVGF